MASEFMSFGGGDFGNDWSEIDFEPAPVALLEAELPLEEAASRQAMFRSDDWMEYESYLYRSYERGVMRKRPVKRPKHKFHRRSPTAQQPCKRC